MHVPQSLARLKWLPKSPRCRHLRSKFARIIFNCETNEQDETRWPYGRARHDHNGLSFAHAAHTSLLPLHGSAWTQQPIRNENSERGARNFAVDCPRGRSGLDFPTCRIGCFSARGGNSRLATSRPDWWTVRLTVSLARALVQVSTVINGQGRSISGAGRPPRPAQNKFHQVHKPGTLPSPSRSPTTGWPYTSPPQSPRIWFNFDQISVNNGGVFLRNVATDGIALSAS